MLLHGVTLVHHFSLQHECTHYTVFKTRRLNEWVGWLCGLVIMLAPKYFRYEHCDHHTWTQQTGRDPEQIPLPKTIWEYAWYLSSVPYWQAKLLEVGGHAIGRMSEQDRAFVPQTEFAAIFWEARVLVIVYVLVIVCMVMFHWSEPLYLWIIPVVLGEPVMRFIRMTEHVGMPPMADMRRNT